MKSISKLKDDARKHEQNEEWEKAIKVYLQVLNVDEDGDGQGEIELPLFNRIGDLCLRLGRPDEAVRYYEEAADKYAEAGLYNNAIALCNKALRYNPNRLELMRKLGQFSASQGFVTDARRYFLEYAERQFNAGAVDDALSALEDFANVSEDADVRELLGRRLHAHGRTAEAVVELQRAYGLRLAAGEQDTAAALRAEIEAIDPNVQFTDSAASAAPSAGQPPTGLPGLSEIEAPSGDAFEIETPADDAFEITAPGGDPDSGSAGFEGFEATGYDSSGDDMPDFGTIEISGYGAGTDSEVDTGAIEGFESTTLDFGSAAADLEPIDLGPDIEHDESSFDLPTLDEDDETTSFELPTLDDHDADDDGATSMFELPTLDDETADDDVSDTTSMFELPSFDDDTEDDDEAEDATSVFELPSFDDGTDDADDDADEATSAFELPSFADDADDDAEDATSVFEMPSFGADTDDDADEATSVFELPSFGADADDDAADDGPFALPSFEDEELDGVFDEADEETGQDVHDVLAGSDTPARIEDEPDAIEVDAAAAGPVEAPGRVADAPRDDSWADDDEDVDAPAAEAVEAEEAKEAEEAEAAGTHWTPDMSLPAAPAAPKASSGPKEPPAPPRAPEGGFIDLGELLAEDDDGDTRFRIHETAPTGDEDRDFAELLSQFKAKVSEHLPAEDAAAHYDLGLAFKEMGLIDEAISEFQIALRADHMRLKVYEELGQCFLQKEQFNIAEKVLRRALESKYDDELELLGVYYTLGRAYEGLGRRDQARDAYERVLGMDINFQDVTERLTRL